MDVQQVQINNIVAGKRQERCPLKILFLLANSAHDLDIQIADLLAQGVAVKAQ